MSRTLIGDVPSDWKRTTLGELCGSGGGDIQTGPFGSQLHASDYALLGIPSVMPHNIGDNVIVEDGIARITSTDAKRLARYLLRAGDIVYSRRGDVERRALVRSEQDGWLCGTGCLRVRLGRSADSRFVSYYLGHSEIRAWIVRHAVGATMPNLNTSILSALPVTLPPEPLQSAISAVLGVFDEKIAVDNRIVHTSFELDQGRFKFLISKTASSSPVGNLLDLMYGKALPAAQRVSGDISVYGSGGITGCHNQALAVGPGVVVGRKGTVGAVYWSAEDFFPIDTTFYIKLLRPTTPIEFAFFTLQNLGLKMMNSDSAVPGLNRSSVLAIPIRTPPEEDIQ